MKKIFTYNTFKDGSSVKKVGEFGPKLFLQKGSRLNKFFQSKQIDHVK